MSAASWRGITPGITNEAEVIEQFGKPEDITRQLNYTSFEYTDKFGWRRLNIWFEFRLGRQIVVGIHRAWPDDEINENEPALRDIVSKYGVPEEVLWSTSREIRYLIWHSEGLAVASPVPRTTICADWEICKPYVTIYFEPMRTAMFTTLPWPRTGLWWSDHDQSPIDARDKFPQNPYDFEEIVGP